MTICVASKNPVKIKAVEITFSKGVLEGNGNSKVISRVVSGLHLPTQPYGIEETYRCAKQRAQIAFESTNAFLGIGIESGLVNVGGHCGVIDWIVIVSNDSIGFSSTPFFLIPPKVVDLVGIGRELGAAVDEVFDCENSKQHESILGILTKNEFSRQRVYEDAVRLALIPYIEARHFAHTKEKVLV
ncbi:inositol monophosphatase [Candidatus Wolfebacteria bacterium]|nr:MAG: inositol monophosphatase [Candidatus Wolfebacteria bacterium]